MAKEFRNRKLASEAGKKSKRGKGVKTQLTEFLIAKHNESKKNGTPLVTMEDLKKDSPVVWLWLRESAETYEQVLLCESHLSKYLHTEKIKVEGEIINEVKVTIVKNDS